MYSEKDLALMEYALAHPGCKRKELANEGFSYALQKLGGLNELRRMLGQRTRGRGITADEKEERRQELLRYLVEHPRAGIREVLRLDGARETIKDFYGNSLNNAKLELGLPVRLYRSFTF